MGELPVKYMKAAAAVYYTLTGWKMEGSLPPEIKRCVLVVAPHTSNYDLIFARMAFFFYERPGYFLIKNDYMHTPLRRILELIGAIGVDRDQSGNMVDRLVEFINSHDNIVLGVAPEGTRGYSERWKTGFYQIAMEAKTPIALMYLDYQRKTTGITILEPSGDIEADMEIIEDFFKTVHPRHPQNYNPVIYPRSAKSLEQPGLN